MLIPDPRRTPLPNLISHNGVILYQWEFLRACLDEGEGLPWIAMDIMYECTVHVRARARARTFVHVMYCVRIVYLLVLISFVIVTYFT